MRGESKVDIKNAEINFNLNALAINAGLTSLAIGIAGGVTAIAVATIT